MPNHRKIGNSYEERAVEFLKQNGFQIVSRNIYTRYGEIDIIAKLGDIHHFVEVKGGESFNPSENLTERKLSRIIKSVESLLSKMDIDEFSIDLITLHRGETLHYRNITI
jgi:putative endonuclease